MARRTRLNEWWSWEWNSTQYESSYWVYVGGMIVSGLNSDRNGKSRVVLDSLLNGEYWVRNNSCVYCSLRGLNSLPSFIRHSFWLIERQKPLMRLEWMKSTLFKNWMARPNFAASFELFLVTCARKYSYWSRMSKVVQIKLRLDKVTFRLTRHAHHAWAFWKDHTRIMVMWNMSMSSQNFWNQERAETKSCHALSWS